MTEQTVISSVSCLRHHQVFSDGSLYFSEPDVDSDTLFLHLYEKLGVNYPKFYKMDSLCKTAFLAVEVLLRQKNLRAGYKPEEIGLIISNAHSSLDTDLHYQQTVNTIPSPALFVYTLPNIMLGEIAIRHGIKGESACFVFDIFDAAFQTAYVQDLFEAGKVKACISGWADFFNGKAEAFFYLAELRDTNANQIHHTNNVSKIYNDLWKN